MEYLNVDIELQFSQGKDILLTALGGSVFVLRSEGHFISFELSKICASIDEVAEELQRIVSGLPDAPSQIWAQCETRRFNIGFRAVQADRSDEIVIPHRSLASLDSLGLDVAVTIYFDEPE